MKKIKIVKKNTDFSDIIKTGKKYSNKYYRIYIKENNLNHERYGIAIATKLGHAVERNKVKRQIKNIIDNNQDKIIKCDYIIMPRIEIKLESFKIKEKELIYLLKKIKGEFKWKKYWSYLLFYQYVFF